MRRCDSVKSSSAVSVLVLSSASASVPLRVNCRIKAGTTIEMSEGMSSSLITPRAVTTPLFQSMMVVTSPMGENAPPELAAMMTIEA